MKKFLALFMVCATALTVSASSSSSKLLFNHAQFQTKEATAAGYELTVPFVYKGSLSLKGWYAVDNDEYTDEKSAAVDSNCVVDTSKATFPMYMTMCQPCIDCYPCTVLGADQTADGAATKADATYPTPYKFTAFGSASTVGYLTRWNVYIINVAKKAKTADIYKINLLEAAPAGAVFFTGAQKELAYAQYAGTCNVVLVGKKSDYKFNYNEATLTDVVDGVATWTASGAKNTAWIKSVTSFAGPICLAQMFGHNYTSIAEGNWGYVNGFQFCGTIKLTRNASLTKKAVNSTFSATTTTSGKHWEDCTETAPAGFCESYFFRPITADTTSYVSDSFDTYLNGAYKKYAITYHYNAGLNKIIESLAGL